MSILRISTYGENVLRRKALPVKNFDPALKQLIGDMTDTLMVAPGVGLAAPQVGQSLRLIIVDTSFKVNRQGVQAYLNPEIVAEEGLTNSEEGCLSVPGYCYELPRASSILFRALDPDGRKIEFTATEMLAIVLQHEVDHLDGILFIDHLNRVKREFFKVRWKHGQKRSESCQNLF